ncbi:MAG: hypothetical protein J2P37_35585, partial [Ktedonobacteraceae bacterium]|nr:hypothetical protein [Ktedonobacteraceae bacterium]
MSSRHHALSGITAIPVFFAVDFDDASEPRFRSAFVPRLGYQAHRLLLSVPAARGKLMYQVAPPTSGNVDAILKRVQDVVTNDLATTRRLSEVRTRRHLLNERIELVRYYMRGAAEAASDLADFNSVFMSKIMNVIFGQATLFVNLRRIRPAMALHMVEIWSQRRTIQAMLPSIGDMLEARTGIAARRLAKISESNLFWRICKACGQRNRLADSRTNCEWCGARLDPLSDAAEFEDCVR